MGLRLKHIMLKPDIRLKIIAYISIGSVFILLLIPSTYYDRGVLAQDKAVKEIDESIGRVFNNSGAVLGLVKINGQITNRFGSPLGSVEDDGTIYNVSKIVIGRINTFTGEVLNQSGTVLGLVTLEGDILNNNGDKLGRVDMDSGDIKLIGGAARLIFFKK